MQKKENKRSAIALTVKILLIILVTVSVLTFAGNIMYYNRLQEQERELKQQIETLQADEQQLQILLEEQKKVQMGLDAYRGNDEETANFLHTENIRNSIMHLMNELFGWRISE